MADRIPRGAPLTRSCSHATCGPHQGGWWRAERTFCAGADPCRPWECLYKSTPVNRPACCAAWRRSPRPCGTKQGSCPGAAASSSSACAMPSGPTGWRRRTSCRPSPCSSTWAQVERGATRSHTRSTETGRSEARSARTTWAPSTWCLWCGNRPPGSTRTRSSPSSIRGCAGWPTQRRRRTPCDIVSRLAKEILALRFHAAKLRVAHLYQTGVRQVWTQVWAHVLQMRAPWAVGLLGDEIFILSGGRLTAPVFLPAQYRA